VLNAKRTRSPVIPGQAQLRAAWPEAVFQGEPSTGGESSLPPQLVDHGRWMRMVELWQLLQPPAVIVVGMVAKSGHLLTTTLAGNEIAPVK